MNKIMKRVDMLPKDEPIKITDAFVILMEDGHELSRNDDNDKLWDYWENPDDADYKAPDKLLTDNQVIEMAEKVRRKSMFTLV